MVLSLIIGGGGGGSNRLLLPGVMLGLVPLEVVGAGEGLAATLTLVGPLLSVHLDVLCQLTSREAGGPAPLLTREILVPRVNLLVLL